MCALHSYVWELFGSDPCSLGLCLNVSGDISPLSTITTSILSILSPTRIHPWYSLPFGRPLLFWHGVLATEDALCYSNNLGESAEARAFLSAKRKAMTWTLVLGRSFLLMHARLRWSITTYAVSGMLLDVQRFSASGHLVFVIHGFQWI